MKILLWIVVIVAGVAGAVILSFAMKESSLFSSGDDAVAAHSSANTLNPPDNRSLTPCSSPSVTAQIQERRTPHTPKLTKLELAFWIGMTAREMVFYSRSEKSESASGQWIIVPITPRIVDLALEYIAQRNQVGEDLIRAARQKLSQTKRKTFFVKLTAVSSLSNVTRTPEKIELINQAGDVGKLVEATPSLRTAFARSQTGVLIFEDVVRPCDATYSIVMHDGNWGDEGGYRQSGYAPISQSFDASEIGLMSALSELTPLFPLPPYTVLTAKEETKLEKKVEAKVDSMIDNGPLHSDYRSGNALENVKNVVEIVAALAGIAAVVL